MNEKRIKELLMKHRRVKLEGRYYVCTCGAVMASNSHARLAKHQADVLVKELIREGVESN